MHLAIQSQITLGYNSVTMITIKIHFQTVEKQQAKDKQFSFKTQTHTAFCE